MIRLALTLAALTGPMIAATSLQADLDYWHGARLWQHTHPVTYYAHTLLLVALVVTLRKSAKGTP